MLKALILIYFKQNKLKKTEDYNALLEILAK